jgi:ABC-2 type transport system ATP-binding protein
MAETEAIIETRRLTRRFGAFVAVNAVDLRVDRGEIFGLIGPNGAGKSTLIKMLTTLLPPSSGTARVAGFDIQSEPEKVRAHIGYVPQLVSVDGSLTAWENLLLSARLYLIARGERSSRIERALAMVGLKDSSQRLVQTFSGGMVRRLEIAQAMLHEPPLLFMDEPTVGLDPVARHSVWDHIRDIRNRLGTTILLTTHLMDEIDALCGRVGVLHQGRLARVGTPQQLKSEVAPGATMDDVFAHITGTSLSEEGSLSDVREARRSAQIHS